MNIGTLTVIMGADTTGLIAAKTAVLDLSATAVKAAKVAYMAQAGALDKLSTNISNVSQKFRTFGYLASAVITLPMVMAGKATFNMAKEYEFAMQKIVGLTGVAQSAVNEWSDAILKMAPKLAQTPQALAEALYFISSSGIKGAEAMRVLELSAKAASSGLGDTKEVADYLTSALNAYRDTGLTAAYATDVLVAAVREGKAEAAGFASAMGQLIPFSAKAGVSLDQVAGAMAAITLTGSSAASAAVYLKGVFNVLVTANKQGVVALEGMELKYSDLRKILAEGPSGLINLMQKFRDIQMKLGDEAVKDVLPNIRSLNAFYSIAGKNFQYNTELMKRVTNATGSLNAAFAAIANTIKFRYDAAIAQANVSMITFGKSLAESALPLIEKLIKKLDNVTKWFDSLSAAQKQNKLEWLAFIAILGPVSLLISVVGYAISGVINAVVLLTKAFNILRFALIANPFTPIIIAVTGLLLILPQLKKYFQEIASTKTQLDQILGTSKDNTLLKGLTEGINTQMKLLDKMSKDQIVALQNNIGTVVQLYEDRRLKLLEVQKNGLKDDQFILNQKKKLAELNMAYAIQQEKFSTAKSGSVNSQHAWGWLKVIEKSIDGINESLRSYGVEVQAVFNKEQKAIDDSIAKYKALQAEVQGTLDVITKYAADMQARFDAEDALSKEIQDIIQGIKDELKYTDVLAKIMKSLGLEYDVVAEKMKIILSGIEKLTKEGFTAQSKEIQNLILQYQKLQNATVTRVPNKQLSELIKPDFVTEAFKILGADVSKPGTLYSGKWEAERAAIESYNKSLMRQHSIIDGLTDSFSEFFQNTSKGFKGMFDALIKALQDYLAKLAALALVSVILNVLIPGSGAAVKALTSLRKFVGTPGYAEGGVVPPGYPNDSYPARLTSGETVIPPGKLGNVAMRPQKVEVIVKGEISANVIALAMRRAKTMN